MFTGNQAGHQQQDETASCKVAAMLRMQNNTQQTNQTAGYHKAGSWVFCQVLEKAIVQMATHSKLKTEMAVCLQAT
jgi:hypothetical protein